MLTFYYFWLRVLDVFMQQSILKEEKEHYVPFISIEEIFLYGHLYGFPLF